MISEQEAQSLLKTLISLRKKALKTKTIKAKMELQQHETKCMQKFWYLVAMRTNRYKQFSNYDDLNQEGYEALCKAMKNYDPKLGSFFYWAHKYIETRISRSANLHTTIRYPLKFAKENPPHKESQIPVMIETRFNPDKILENSELKQAVESVLVKLSPEQRDLVSLAYGFNGDRPLSINKICKKKNLSRVSCTKTINAALNVIKENIKL